MLRDEKVVFCGYMISQWGHFLIETVPRLWYCLQEDERIDHYVFILENESQRQVEGNYLEFLRLLGIADKCVFINQPTRYRTVIVPELSYSRTQYFTDQYRETFQYVVDMALKEGSDTCSSKKIFLSRNHFKKARDTEFGLDLLDNFFAKNGFDIIYPEETSLPKLITLVQEAEVCAASSGTAPHNFLFAQQGKKILIMERQATVNEIQIDLDVVKDFDVTYIDSHYSVYPVSAGGGPFFFAYTEWFGSFVRTNGYLEPDGRYIGDAYNEKNLRSFLKLYFDWYGYTSAMDAWMLMYADLYYEAHDEARKDLGEWLYRRKPLFAGDILSIRYLKALARRILK